MQTAQSSDVKATHTTHDAGCSSNIHFCQDTRLQQLVDYFKRA